MAWRRHLPTHTHLLVRAHIHVVGAQHMCGARSLLLPAVGVSVRMFVIVVGKCFFFVNLPKIINIISCWQEMTRVCLIQNSLSAGVLPGFLDHVGEGWGELHVAFSCQRATQGGHLNSLIFI